MGDQKEGEFSTESSTVSEMAIKDREDDYTVVSYKILSVTYDSVSASGLLEEMEQTFSERAKNYPDAGFDIVFDKKARLTEIRGLVDYLKKSMLKNDMDSAKAEEILSSFNLDAFDAIINKILQNKDFRDIISGYFPTGKIEAGTEWKYASQVDFNLADLFSFMDTEQELPDIIFPLSYESHYVVSKLNMSQAIIDSKSVFKLDIGSPLESLIKLGIDNNPDEAMDQETLAAIAMFVDMFKNNPLTVEMDSQYVIDVKTGIIKKQVDYTVFDYSIDTSLELQGLSLPIAMDFNMTINTEATLK